MKSGLGSATKRPRPASQHIPRIGKIHRSLLPLMPLAIELLDLSKYDLVISSSCAVAKGVITGPDQVHIAYIHSPMRYAWDLQHQYLSEAGGWFGLKRVLARVLLSRIRLWDASSGGRPNHIIANSAFIRRRIKKVFGRDATIVHPPVDVAASTSGARQGDHFLAAGRLVSYKNVRAVVEAFKLMPEHKLIVAGSGPEGEKLRALAGPNVTFTGFVDDAEMRRLMATARALIFAAEEDFGMIPVEAQAEGTSASHSAGAAPWKPSSARVRGRPECSSKSRLRSAIAACSTLSSSRAGLSARGLRGPGADIYGCPIPQGVRCCCRERDQAGAVRDLGSSRRQARDPQTCRRGRLGGNGPPSPTSAEHPSGRGGRRQRHRGPNYRRRRLFAWVFGLISLPSMLAVAVWPPSYYASGTVFVGEQEPTSSAASPAWIRSLAIPPTSKASSSSFARIAC